MTAARLLLLYFGYTQYFVWAALFECLMWAFTGCLMPGSRLPPRQRGRALLTYGLSWVAFAFFGLPLLWPQYG